MITMISIESKSDSLLLELRHAHEQVLCAMEELKRVTCEYSPNERRLTHARWKLSLAGMQRHSTWQRICLFLMSRVSIAEEAELQRLQSIDAKLRTESSEHIGKWTIAAILSDWPGYCDASRAMRWQMIGQMEEEKRILYPLLRTICSSAVSQCATERQIAA